MPYTSPRLDMTRPRGGTVHPTQRSVPMVSLVLVSQLVVLFAAIAIGARAGGVGMGLWGGVGLAVLVFGFGAAPGGIPGEVLLIILAVIMAASAMEAAGGVDFPGLI